MTPFVVFAIGALAAGALCCLPIVITGMAVAWLPTLARHAVSWVRTSSEVARLGRAAHEKPRLAIGAVAVAPLLLFILGAMVFCFFFFAPLTFPLTVYGAWFVRGKLVPPPASSLSKDAPTEDADLQASMEHEPVAEMDDGGPCAAPPAASPPKVLQREVAASGAAQPGRAAAAVPVDERSSPTGVRRCGH
jgi:hypothetical protein